MGEYPPDNMNIQQGGVKLDADKAAMDLMRPEFVIELGKLCAKGAAKYKRRNWEMGMRWGRVYAAMQRHANAFWAGETHDEEGNHHLISVAWNAMVLWWYSVTEKYKQYDDRNDIPGAQVSILPDPNKHLAGIVPTTLWPPLMNSGISPDNNKSADDIFPPKAVVPRWPETPG